MENTQVRFANIFNIISNSEIIPELLQNKCNPKNIYKVADSYVQNPKLGEDQILNCEKILKNMRVIGSSSERVANILNESL